jgi:hypothetical protein
MVSLALAIHSASLTTSMPARAQQPAPAARPQQDLIARGQALFEDQQYEESVQTLSAALVRPVNSKAQKVDIYRFLALNFITLNRKDEAESAVRGLLSIQPDYALPPGESPRFRDFFASVQKKWEAEGRPGLVQEAQAPPAPVSMRHTSPSQIAAGTSLELTARLDDPPGRVASVKLYFRSGSRGKFETNDASLQAQSVHATIPSAAVRPPLVEYYFQGFDKGGLPIVSRGDAGSPLRVVVPEPSKGWVLPVAIGGGILGAAAIVGGLALAGVFKSSPPPTAAKPPAGSGNSTVTVTVGESSVRW